jgi:hypothetical protein
MKKVFLVLMATIFVGINVYSQTVDRDSQWDFFSNVIPRQNSITISGRTEIENIDNIILNWRMTIDDKYNVSFSGDIDHQNSHHRDMTWTGNNAIIINSNAHVLAWTKNKGVSVTYRGTGSLVWDNDKMKVVLVINTSGVCRTTFYFNFYEAVRGRDKRKTLSDSEEFSSSGNTNLNLTFDLQSDYNSSNSQGQMKLLLSQNALTINMRGSYASDFNGKPISFNYPCTISPVIGGNTWYTATVTPKSQSELNSSSNDQFGNWNWNADRTRLFLKSQNSDNKFVILNNNGTLTWCMEMLKGARGSSESTTDTGDKIVNWAVAFDGAPAQNFSFVENNEGISDQNFAQFDYAVYNRFVGTLDKNANEILNQFKDKKILMLSYTLNGVRRTDMFMLRGLETILEHM